MAADSKHNADDFYPQDKRVSFRRYSWQGETFYVALFEGSTAPQYFVIPPDYYGNDDYWYKASVLSRLLNDGHEFFDAFKFLAKTAATVRPDEIEAHAPLSFVSRVFSYWDTLNELTNLYTDKPTPEMLALVRACKDRFDGKVLRQHVDAANQFVKDHSGPNRAGWVYLIRNMIGQFKIGLSINPCDRLETFDIKLPFQVYPICFIRSDNALALERELHQRFSSVRLNNSEFFDLTYDDVQYIKGLAS